MKKFLTYVAMQPEKFLLQVNYEPVDNDDITTDRKVYFPISVVVETYAKKGEEIELICLKEEGNDDIARNAEILQKEIEAIAEEIGFSVKWTAIVVDSDESAEGHLETFSNIIQNISDSDELYACCTYGTKPVPIIEVMALNYAYRVLDDVQIKHIVYGKIIRRNGQFEGAKLYDVTALFFMLQIVNQLADAKVERPENVIRSILSLED